MTKIDPDQDYRRMSNQSDGNNIEISRGVLITGAIIWIAVIVSFAWYAYS